MCTSFIGQPGAVNSYWVQTSLCSRNNQGKNLGTNERLFHQTNLMICFLFNLCTEKKEGKISINKSDEQSLCLCMIVLSLSWILLADNELQTCSLNEQWVHVFLHWLIIPVFYITFFFLISRHLIFKHSLNLEINASKKQQQNWYTTPLFILQQIIRAK